MKLRATISAEVKITKDDEPHDLVRDRVIKELIKTVDEWLNGDVPPVITFHYELNDDMTDELKVSYVN
tara:strand:+ start:3015 stop:3218 length:204 start_codon:yes stop_codon:yes gene_type:complete